MAIGSSVVLLLGGCASSSGIARSPSRSRRRASALDAGAAPTPRRSPPIGGASSAMPLDDLVERALAGNPTLKIAQARLERAQAAVAGAQAAAGPQVDGELDVTRQPSAPPASFRRRWAARSALLGTASSRLVGARLLRPQPRRARGGHRRRARRAGRRARRRASCSRATSRAPTCSSAACSSSARSLQRALAQREEMLSLISQRVWPGWTPPSNCARARARARDAPADRSSSTSRSRWRATRSPRSPPSRPTALDGLARGCASCRRCRCRPRCRPTCSAAAPTSSRRAGASRPRAGDVHERQGAVLSEHQPDRRSSASSSSAWTGSSGRQRAVRRRPGDPPADLRRRPAARQSARPDRRPRRRGRELQRARARRGARRRRPDQLAALDRAPAGASRRRRRPPPRRPTTSPLQRYRAGLGTYLTVLTAETNVLDPAPSRPPT